MIKRLSHRNNQLTFCLFLMCSNLLSNVVAHAKDQTTAANTQQSAGTQTWRDMRQLPDFPRLPRYPGQYRVLNGSMASRQALITSVFRVGVQEPVEQVRDWYTQALKMYGWSVQVQGHGLYATNSDGNSVVVSAIPSSSARQGATIINLAYQERKSAGR